VITVVDLTKKEHADRELLLLKYEVPSQKKEAFMKMKDKFCARLAFEKEESYILELAADSPGVKEFIEASKEFKVTELVRTGKIAIGK